VIKIFNLTLQNNPYRHPKRADKKVRKLRKTDPDSHYESGILRTYPDKATSKKFEKNKIVEKRKVEARNALPDNKNNH
jgi:hypothetical protein